MTHPDAEQLAAFAEGVLDPAEVRTLTAHLAQCAECRADVEEANDALHAERRDAARPAGEDAGTPKRWYWLAAAAAVVIALFLVPFRRETRLETLVPDDRRVVEPRLSGSFDWAPYRGPLRASGEDDDPRTMKLVGAAGELAERADRERSADAQHTAGVAMLLVGRTSASVDRLRDATKQSPNDAGAWSDLAAAEYVDAVSGNRPSRLPEALAAADRALHLDPNHAAAAFNRALILERLGVTRDARAAWQRYLEIDASSPWANEARERLKALPEETGESRFTRELPQFERADAAAVHRYVTLDPQRSRVWAETEWLGRWGEAIRSNDDAAATRLLGVARATGSALQSLSKESLLADAVAAIEAEDVHTLAAAHATYRAGRIAYSRARPIDAEKDLRRAAAGFAEARSPMSLVARYYAACTRFDQNDVAGARRELETLHAEVPSRYAALQAQIEWELGLCHMTAGDWNAALPHLNSSEATFVRLGERSNAAFVQTLLADTLAATGQPEASWSARVRSFRALSVDARGTQLPVSLGAASRMDLRMARFAAARALLRLEQSAARAVGKDSVLADTLLREAVVAAKVGDVDGAARAAREASAVAARIADPALRARALADVDFAAGAIDGDPRRARELLTRAIDAYRGGVNPFYLAEGLLLRARASRRVGDDVAAARDLSDGIDWLAKTPVRLAGPVTGTGVLDAGAALFEDAIALELDRGDAAKAFAYAERARLAITHAASKPVTAGELSDRLRKTGVAVIAVVSLPKEVAAFAVDERGLAVHRHPIAREVLVEWIERDDSAWLYDVLVRPFERVLDRSRQWIFVADRRLASVPFAALYDRARSRHLVEAVAVSIAENASALQPRVAQRPARIVAAALPTGGATNSVALPAGAAEASALRGIYGEAIVLSDQRATFAAFLEEARRADIAHVAGHTDRETAEGDAALAFAERRVTWSSVAEERLPEMKVVVLAACETLRAPASPDARSLSLGAAFVAAGAREVIGTLEPVADADAFALFSALHRHLAAGVGAAEALRREQLRAMTQEPPGRRGGAWRSLAHLTTTISRH